MSYHLLTGWQSPANRYTPGRDGHAIDTIVIHWWGWPAQSGSFDGTLRWFCDPSSGAQTSAHYVVEPGRVACIVDPDDTAWHAGNWPVNQRSIGIECSPHDIPGTLPTVVELVAALMRTYGRGLRVIGHRDASSTTCPGEYYPLISVIRARALALLDDAPSKPTTQPPAADHGSLIDKLKEISNMTMNPTFPFILHRASNDPRVYVATGSGAWTHIRDEAELTAFLENLGFETRRDGIDWTLVNVSTPDDVHRFHQVLDRLRAGEKA